MTANNCSQARPSLSTHSSTLPFKCSESLAFLLDSIPTIFLQILTFARFILFRSTFSKIAVFKLQLIAALADSPLNSIIESAERLRLNFDGDVRLHAKRSGEQHWRSLDHVGKRRLLIDRGDHHRTEEHLLFGGSRWPTSKSQRLHKQNSLRKRFCMRDQDLRTASSWRRSNALNSVYWCRICVAT
jgi:hypothetical protein